MSGKVVWNWTEELEARVEQLLAGTIDLTQFRAWYVDAVLFKGKQWSAEDIAALQRPDGYIKINRIERAT